MPNNRRRWDPDVGVVYIVVVLAVIMAFMIWMVNQPYP